MSVIFYLGCFFMTIALFFTILVIKNLKVTKQCFSIKKIRDNNRVKQDQLSYLRSGNKFGSMNGTFESTQFKPNIGKLCVTPKRLPRTHTYNQATF